jgi:hypothetical protein
MSSNPLVTIRNILDVFFQMEVDENLFSMQMTDGTHYWDVIRTHVYLCLHAAHGGPFTRPTSSNNPSALAGCKDLLRPLVNAVSRRYLIARSPAFVCFTFQRIRSGPRLVDTIADHLVDLLGEDAVAVELLNKSAISYPKLLTGEKTRVPMVSIRAPHNPSESEAVAGFVNKLITCHFGISLDVTDVVVEAISAYETTRAYYREVFSSTRLRAILGTNNGSLGGAFSAAKEAGIPSIELQHGGSSRHTIYWSYPGAITASHPGLSLPTAYFTYSDYWRDNTHFPVKMFRSIGTDYFHHSPIPAPGEDVLMISSYMYRDVLFDMALELADKDIARNIVFKLHPHEFDSKARLVARCGARANIEIVTDEHEFAQLFARCQFVVGVQSTTIYLALQAGKRVCLLKHSNYFWHEDIFSYVELFSNSSELHDILQNRDGIRFTNHASIPALFEPFSATAFLEALNDVHELMAAERTPVPVGSISNLPHRAL